MTEFKEDYDKGIDRFLGRFWGKKEQTSNIKRIRQIHRKSNHGCNIFEEIRNGELFRQTVDIPVKHNCQVLVVGGGPAGLSAALGSARTGADTMLIERFGCFGGVITTAGMETLGWYRYEGTYDCEGIGRELERVAISLGYSRQWAMGANESPCLDAEHFKSIADDLILQAGVRPLLHTTVVDTLVNQASNTVLGVVIENKEGRSIVLADRIIDCSGDGDVAYQAGCEFTKLPLEEAMGITAVFNVSGVDKKKFENHIEKNSATYLDWSRTWNQETTGKENHLMSPYWDKEFEDAVNDGTIDKLPDHVSLGGSWSSLTDTGEATNLNLVHMQGFDPLNASDLTTASMDGRRHTANAIVALRSKIPGFEQCTLRNFAMTLGIRDSRKIVTRYILTGNDVCKQGRFNDSIGIFPEFIDGYSILILPTTGRYYQVPYGCLVTEVNNLLVAGRCVGGDMVAHASTRNMMCCAVTGQGAGVAAAVSILNGQSTHAIDISLVHTELRRQKATISGPDTNKSKL